MTTHPPKWQLDIDGIPLTVAARERTMRAGIGTMAVAVAVLVVAAVLFAGWWSP